MPFGYMSGRMCPVRAIRMPPKLCSLEVPTASCDRRRKHLISPTPSAPAAADEAEWLARATSLDRLNRRNPKLALEQAETWLLAEQARGSAEGHARALRAHAHALRFLGQYEAAVAEYEQAEAQFEQLGHRLEAGRTSIGHVTALRYLGRYADAAALAQSSRAGFLAHGHRLEAAKQSNNLGTVYRPMGRLADALAAYRAARPVFRQLGERSALADVEQNIGNVLGELGRHEDALAHLRAAERLRRALGMHSEVALTLLNIGVLSYRRGEYGAALRVLLEAREIYESLAYERGLVSVDLELLPIYAALNLTEEVRTTAARAIGQLRMLDMPLELGMALVAAGRHASAQGDLDVADSMLQEAHALFTRTGNVLWASVAALFHAELSASSHDQDVFVDLAACRRLTSFFEQVGAVEHAVEGLLFEGRLLAGLDQTDAALASFRRALAIADDLAVDHLRYRSHAALGDLLMENDPDAAIASYRQAVTYLQAVRERAHAEELKLSFAADKVDLYERAVGALLREATPDRVAEAYLLVESSRSRSLLEEIAEQAGARRHDERPRVRSLLRTIRDLRVRLTTTYARAFGGPGVPSADRLGVSGDAETIASLERELARATRELQLAERPDRTAAAEFYRGIGILPDETALVEYYGLGDQLLAFVRRGSSLSLHDLGSLETLEGLLDNLNLQLGRISSASPDAARASLPRWRRGADTCLHALWATLIMPLREQLEGAEHLVLVPHGALHGLPFHAFVDHSGRYLSDSVAISYAPSASVFERCARMERPPGDRLLLVGVDDDDLPWVRGEVHAVAKIWPKPAVRLGRRATRRMLRRNAGQYDILHIATHAVFRSDNPSFSSIRLADAWLTVNDLADLVHGAKLVTLAACETGVGAVAAGNEVIGLTRGLLAAGCTAAVTSLWSVNDQTTATLMPIYYAGLRAGLGPSEALRRAMNETRAAFDHPYYWAPFIVVGDGRRGLGDRVAVERRTS